MENIFLLGLDHHQSPVDVREALAAVDATQIDAVLSPQGVTENTLLATCNRYEIYGYGALDAAQTIQALESSAALPAGTLQPYIYHKVGDAALSHGFQVAASLQSMVVGEPQILGQMKAAWQDGKARGRMGTFLDRYGHAAFRVGKRVRTETAIGRASVSVASMAVHLAQDVHGDLEDATVLLVGAGDMCEQAAHHFRAAGVSRMLVTNRSTARGMALADCFDANLLPFEQMAENLARADVVLTSTASRTFVIDVPMVKQALKLRKNKPLLLIDIAVPRDVDPLVHDLPNCFLYDIDHLGQLVRKSVAARQENIAAATEIVEEELTRFKVWWAQRQRASLVRDLRAHFYQMRDEVLARNLDAEQATRLLINKLLHRPTLQLRDGQDEVVRSITALFNLNTQKDNVK